ncbi:MAG: hypothetical protein KDC39_03360 [Actinobacteria bacterium]|nr:hypothetical protein [Actinomycetota bacterium]
MGTTTTTKSTISQHERFGLGIDGLASTDEIASLPSFMYRQQQRRHGARLSLEDLIDVEGIYRAIYLGGLMVSQPARVLSREDHAQAA